MLPLTTGVQKLKNTKIKRHVIHLLHKFLLLLLGLMCLGLVAFVSKTAYAANPATINFQGKVVNANGTNVTDGTYSVVFRIYNTSSPTMTTSCTSSASCLWEETQGSVSVTSGTFQVELGSACALTSSSCNNSTGGPINFASTSSLYLTMQFNGDTSGSNGGFMFPLIHVNSVPFALQADNASTLGGLAASSFVQLAQGSQADTSTSNPSIFVNKNNASGSPNILQLQKSGVNTVVVDNSGTLLLGQSNTGGLTGKLTFNNSSNTSTVSITSGATSATYTIILPTGAPSADSYCLVMTNHSTGATGFMACGAGATATTILTPEYAGAVMTGDGSNNTGTMTSDFCSNTVGSLPALTAGCNTGETHNFYQWTSASGTNDYEIFVKWAVPSDFSSFSSVAFNGFRTTTSDAVTLTLYNAAGSSCGSASIAGTVNTWNDNTAVTTSCTPSAGSIMTLDIHLSAAASDFARSGEITITYNRN